MTAALQLLTVPEVAEQLRCSVKAVRRLISAGRLATVRLGLSGKSDRVHPDDLQRYIDLGRACRSRNAGESGSTPYVGAGKSIADLVAIGRAIKPQRRKRSSSMTSTRNRSGASRRERSIRA